jgi:hypothetical protein
VFLPSAGSFSGLTVLIFNTPPSLFFWVLLTNADNLGSRAVLHPLLIDFMNQRKRRMRLTRVLGGPNCTHESCVWAKVTLHTCASPEVGAEVQSTLYL